MRGVTTFILIFLCHVTLSQDFKAVWNDWFPKSDSLKQIKAGNNFDKRNISRGTHAISFYVANNQYPIILGRNTSLLQKRRSPGFNREFLVNSAVLKYEFSLKNNWYIESTFKYMQNTYSYKVKPGMLYGFGRNDGYATMYGSLNIDLGGGYRIRAKNNLRIVDFCVGLSLGFLDVKKGDFGQFTTEYIYPDENNNSGFLSINANSEVINTFFYAFYVGFNKDVRLTNNLFLTGRYTYHLGSWSRHTEFNVNYSASSYNINSSVKGYLTGEGQVFALGLKWFFRD